MSTCDSLNNLWPGQAVTWAGLLPSPISGIRKPSLHGYLCTYGWVPSLFTWNYQDVVNRLYPNTKEKVWSLEKKMDPSYPFRLSLEWKFLMGNVNDVPWRDSYLLLLFWIILRWYLHNISTFPISAQHRNIINNLSLKKEFIGPGLHLRPVHADHAQPPFQWTLNSVFSAYENSNRRIRPPSRQGNLEDRI